MPQYLYRVRPARPEFFRAPTPEEETAVGEHFAYLQNLTRKSVVLLAGRTLNEDSTSFGIVIFEASSDEEARALMLADPVVRAGVFLAELFPYRVALASSRLLPTQSANDRGAV